MKTLIVVLVLVVVAAVLLVSVYNKLVRGRNAVDNAWAQIDVQLRRRHDLVPNLVETVRGDAAHEPGTFESVTAARTAAMNATGPTQQAAAENELTNALRSLFAVAEAYPQLQAGRNFAELQGELSDTENRIAYSRHRPRRRPLPPADVVRGHRDLAAAPHVRGTVALATVSAHEPLPFRNGSPAAVDRTHPARPRRPCPARRAVPLAGRGGRAGRCAGLVDGPG
ncbi:MAG TPA: LemA family protein [Pseudonocardia sp.]|nr:LemA family protein [Pseudonocardia sp.]